MDLESCRATASQVILGPTIVQEKSLHAERPGRRSIGCLSDLPFPFPWHLPETTLIKALPPSKLPLSWVSGAHAAHFCQAQAAVTKKKKVGRISIIILALIPFMKAEPMCPLEICGAREVQPCRNYSVVCFYSTHSRISHPDLVRNTRYMKSSQIQHTKARTRSRFCARTKSFSGRSLLGPRQFPEDPKPKTMYRA